MEGGRYLYKFWYVRTVLAFLVKLPIFIFHLWLPKAHVEAPIAGSIILAGVLLKLGGYGLIRVLIVFQEVNRRFCWLWVRLGIVGGVYISLICIRQVDIKSWIAYSSVVHVRLVLCGVIILSWWGLAGRVILMVGHGLCSSGLFCLANVVYERTGRRRLIVNEGLLAFIPSKYRFMVIFIKGEKYSKSSFFKFSRGDYIIDFDGFKVEKNLYFRY